MKFLYSEAFENAMDIGPGIPLWRAALVLIIIYAALIYFFLDKNRGQP